MNGYKQRSRHGKSFLPIEGDGRLKRVFVTEKANWRWKAHAYGPLKIVSNCLVSLHWFILSFSIYSNQSIQILCNLYSVSNATELESGVEKSSHRFTDYAGRSVVFGMTLTQLLAVFFLRT